MQEKIRPMALTIKHARRNLILGQVFTGMLAAGWAYSTHVGNRLNVNGRPSPYMQDWITLSSLLPYVTLSLWILMVLWALGAPEWRQQRPVWRWV